MNEPNISLHTEEQRFRETLSIIAENDRKRRRTGLVLLSMMVMVALFWLITSVI